MASIRSSVSNDNEQLQDAKTEIKALDELVDNLTHDQIRLLQAKIRTVDFRSDPMDKLPFELCYQILQHLEIYQVFQAQRVSRNWLRVLSSPEVLKTLTLKAWFGISNTSLSTSPGFFQGVCTLSSGLSPGAEISLRARHIDSLRNGTAFSMARRKWPKNRHQFAGIDFAGSILAWRDPQAGCIILECVVSGRSISLFTPSREEISQIAISDTTLVALSVSGSCYAWDLSGGVQEVEGQSPECIETHVKEWQMMSVSGKTVVTCCCDYNKEMMNFTTWNIQGHQWHQFRMQLDEPGFDPRYYDYFVLITPGGASFVFFEAVSTKTQFTRMDLSGQVEASGFIHHPEIEGYSMHSKYGTAVCTASCVTIWSYARTWEVLDAQLTRSHALEVMRVVYDTKTDRLEVQRNVVKHSIETDFNAKDLVWWNDVAYFWKYAGETEELHVLDLKASICKRAEMCVPETLVRHNYRFFEESFGLFPILLFGKESLLISIRSEQYTVWCFEDIKLANEDPDYRAMMKAKKQQRLIEK